MNNIFENAYFSKAYKTRDGRKAIYIRKSNVYEHLAMREYPYVSLILEDCSLLHVLEENGLHNINDNLDIVSEWQDEINEEELDNLANKSAKRLYTGFMKTIGIWISGFKAGYRKALEKLK